MRLYSSRTEDIMKTAYLFVHFKGNEGTPDDEQIYFAVSRDGYSWKNLNGAKPVIRSGMGEHGLRDPHIMRKHDGSGFYLIATDLSIYNRGNNEAAWRECQRSGSRHIMVWESKDLVNWSGQSMREIAPKNAGCAWAPEAVYDGNKNMYIVYWSSKTSDDDYTKERVYYSYTKDFKSFDEPKIYIEREYETIDTTILAENGKYYRFTKNETDKSIFMETSCAPDGEFTDVEGFSLKGVPGFEGPTVCRVNGEDQYFLFLDAFASGEGYQPYMTDDIDSGNFVKQSGFKTPDIFRHGTIMPIYEEEYRAVVNKYGIDE